MEVDNNDTTDLQTLDDHHADIILHNSINPEYKKAMKQIISTEPIIAVGFYGTDMGEDGTITLAQIFAPNTNKVHIIDILADDNFLALNGLLTEILRSHTLVKVFHSCSKISAALIGQHNITMDTIFDLQIADIILQELVEKHKIPNIRDIRTILKQAECDVDTSNYLQTQIIDIDYWKIRPLTKEMVMTAAQDLTLFVPTLYEQLIDELEEKQAYSVFQDRVEEALYSSLTDKNDDKRLEYYCLTWEKLKDDIKNIPSSMQSYNTLSVRDKHTIGQLHLSPKNSMRLYYWKDENDFAIEPSPRHIRKLIAKRYVKIALEIQNSVNSTKQPDILVPVIQEMMSLTHHAFLQRNCHTLLMKINRRCRQLELSDIKETISGMKKKYKGDLEPKFNLHEIEVMKKLELSHKQDHIVFCGFNIRVPPAIVVFVSLEMIKKLREIENHLKGIRKSVMSFQEMKKIMDICKVAKVRAVYRVAQRLVRSFQSYSKRKRESESGKPIKRGRNERLDTGSTTVGKKRRAVRTLENKMKRRKLITGRD